MKSKTRPKNVLLVLPLAYQDGRDKYAGFLRYVSEKGLDWNILLEREHLSPNRAKKLLKNMPDGVVPDGTCDSATLRILSAAPCCVALDVSSHQPFEASSGHTAFVDIDSDELGHIAADCFLARTGLGCVAFVGYGEPVLWSRRRQQAFVAKMSAAGHSVQHLRLPYAGEVTHTARKSLRRFLAGLPHPVALFAACDRLARWVAEVALESEIAIPNEISVLGVDNEEIICTHTRPTLSSLQPDFTSLGYEAAQLLDLMFRGRRLPKEPTNVSGARLIERESTAPSYSASFLVARVKDAIQHWTDGNPHIEDIACKLGVSRRLVDLRFKEITGRTVLEYIRREKLEKVMRFLCETDIPIKTICEDCAFRSVNHLKRIFKQFTGMSMRAWRNEHTTMSFQSTDPLPSPRKRGQSPQTPAHLSRRP